MDVCGVGVYCLGNGVGYGGCGVVGRPIEEGALSPHNNKVVVAATDGHNPHHRPAWG